MTPPEPPVDPVNAAASRTAAKPPPLRVMGLDIGQETDPAAVVRLAIYPSLHRTHDDPLPVWLIESAANLPHRTRYSELAAYAASLANVVPIAIDATGIGRAVVELAREQCGPGDGDPVLHDPRAAQRVIGVTWTSGLVARHEYADWKVPKSILVEHVTRALDHGGLRSRPGQTWGAELQKQLSSYYRDGKSTNAVHGAHDDLVAALMLALYAADTLASVMLPGAVGLPATMTSVPEAAT